MIWDRRNLTVAEAAAMSGIRRSQVDLLIHRAKAVETLFSEKRGSRRWFSPRDVCVLRIAFELERSGRNWLTAIGTAFDNLFDGPPEPDALLIAPAVQKRACGLPYIAKQPPAVFERSEIIIPIGRIVADINKEAELVALQ
jgi:hypothetical protein